jgi:hypothetical protein
MGLTPSLLVLALALVLNGGEFFDNLFHGRTDTVTVAVASGGTQTFSNPVPPRLIAYAGTAGNLLCFLGFCLNFSLQLRWTALPAALGTWAVTTIIVQISSTTLMQHIIGPWKGSSPFEYAELARIPILLIIAAVLLIDANRQIIRHAADN